MQGGKKKPIYQKKKTGASPARGNALLFKKQEKTRAEGTSFLKDSREEEEQDKSTGGYKPTIFLKKKGTLRQKKACASFLLAMGGR